MRNKFNQQHTLRATPDGEGFTALPISLLTSTLSLRGLRRDSVEIPKQFPNDAGDCFACYRSLAMTKQER
jgi:hypothetical protein